MNHLNHSLSRRAVVQEKRTYLPVGDRRRIVEISWDERAREYLDTWGLTQEEAEKIICFPGFSTLDPYSAEVKHPVIRHRSGDVTIVVGYREPHRPQVLSIWVNTPEQPGGVKERTATSAGPGKDAPTTVKELWKRIKSYGYELGSGGHPKVIDPETGKVFFSTPSTPSDHRSITNTWRGFLKAHEKLQAEKEASRG